MLVLKISEQMAVFYGKRTLIVMHYALCHAIKLSGSWYNVDNPEEVKIFVLTLTALGMRDQDLIRRLRDTALRELNREIDKLSIPPLRTQISAYRQHFSTLMPIELLNQS